MSIVLISLVVVLLGTVQTRQLNWQRLFYSEAKIPFGTYAFGEYAEDMFTSVEKSRNSMLELLDTLTQPQSFMSISNTFNASELEVDQLLRAADMGSHFFVSAHYFEPKLLDTLGIGLDTLHVTFGIPIINFMDEGEFRDYSFSIGDYLITDTTHIMVRHSNYSGQKGYAIKKRDLLSQFSQVDDRRFRVLATNDNSPVLIEKTIGKGKIILSSVPHLFSNLYLIQGGNIGFLEYQMSFLPGTMIHWTEFYEVGRKTSRSILRYAISEPALKIAIYLIFFGVLVFAFFEVKRKQRPIPIVNPPVNDTLEFTRTIGNLYFENKENLRVAEKRIQYFLEFVRTHYFLKTDLLDDAFVDALSRKSGHDPEKVRKITDQIRYVKSNNEISDKLLSSLSNLLDDFYTMNPIN